MPPSPRHRLRPLRANSHRCRRLGRDQDVVRAGLVPTRPPGRTCGSRFARRGRRYMRASHAHGLEFIQVALKVSTICRTACATSLSPLPFMLTQLSARTTLGRRHTSTQATTRGTLDSERVTRPGGAGMSIVGVNLFGRMGGGEESEFGCFAMLQAGMMRHDAMKYDLGWNCSWSVV